MPSFRDPLITYLKNNGLAVSRLINTLRGGHPDDSSSHVIGRSILTGGFWSNIPLPRTFRRHCLKAFIPELPHRDSEGWF